MRRSKYRRPSRNPSWFTGKRRLVAAGATLVAFGGIVTVSQVSDAGTDRSVDRALAACDRLQAPKASKLSTETRRGTWTTNNGRVTQHSDDGASDVVSTATLRQRCRDWVIDNVGNPSAGEPSAEPSESGDNGGNTGGDNAGTGDNGGNTGGDNAGTGDNGGNTGGDNAGGDNAGNAGGDNAGTGDNGDNAGGDNGDNAGGDNGGNT